ncbi:hypothetical protein [Rhodococcus ruber]|uniref:hypothetical protein n=1 Tax=Rhodococcus ruber TaxID=1830 RepID=UPI001F2C1505|nr:hypothetical protein [Rhodococcus ruber]MCF8784280.1 hypothetical protein [Rhodococcus ruber]
MIRSRNADPGSACRVGRLPRYRSYPGIRWQLVELQAGAELIRSTIHNTAWMMGEFGKTEVTAKVAMVDLRRRRVVCCQVPSGVARLILGELRLAMRGLCCHVSLFPV